MTTSLTTPSLFGGYLNSKQVLFAAGAITTVASLYLSDTITRLTASVALPGILAVGFLLDSSYSPKETPLTLQPPTPVDQKPETTTPPRLSFSNIMLHPLRCSESTLWKIAALIASVALTALSLGFIRCFCTDNTQPDLTPTSIIQTQDSTQIRSYPGDLSSAEKSIWTATALASDKKTLQLNSSKHPGYNFTIRDQDLFSSGAQVIVNAANSHLGGGGGIDGAIHTEGGSSYANAHKELKKAYNASYPLGYAAMIKSGDLTRRGINNVIVVAGPQGATSSTKENQLYSAYYNSLELAHSQGKSSIAFPAISTGIFGFPKDRAAAISIRAVSDFMNKYPDANLTISIHAFQSPGDSKTGLDYYGLAV